MSIYLKKVLNRCSYFRVTYIPSSHVKFMICDMVHTAYIEFFDVYSKQ